MASFTINSRKHGEVTFQANDAGGYVRVSGAKWNHKQICSGGSFGGNTLSADEKTLEKTARQWWKSYLAAEREFGL